MDDGVDALDRAPNAVRVGHVPGDELHAPRGEGLRLLRARVADERAHVVVLGPDRVHDPGADEPRAPRDDNLHRRAGASAKFCQ